MLFYEFEHDWYGPKLYRSSSNCSVHASRAATSPEVPAFYQQFESGCGDVKLYILPRKLYRWYTPRVFGRRDMYRNFTWVLCRKCPFAFFILRETVCQNPCISIETVAEVSTPSRAPLTGDLKGFNLSMTGLVDMTRVSCTPTYEANSSLSENVDCRLPRPRKNHNRKDLTGASHAVLYLG